MPMAFGHFVTGKSSQVTAVFRLIEKRQSCVQLFCSILAGIQSIDAIQFP